MVFSNEVNSLIMKAWVAAFVLLMSSIGLFLPGYLVNIPGRGRLRQAFEALAFLSIAMSWYIAPFVWDAVKATSLTGGIDFLSSVGLVVLTIMNIGVAIFIVISSIFNRGV